MSTDPQSELWVILNAVAVLLALEKDPKRRELLYKITAAARCIEEELRAHK